MQLNFIIFLLLKLSRTIMDFALIAVAAVHSQNQGPASLGDRHGGFESSNNHRNNSRNSSNNFNTSRGSRSKFGGSGKTRNHPYNKKKEEVKEESDKIEVTITIPASRMNKALKFQGDKYELLDLNLLKEIVAEIDALQPKPPKQPATLQPQPSET